jgi:hypothetical protein
MEWYYLCKTHACPDPNEVGACVWQRASALRLQATTWLSLRRATLPSERVGGLSLLLLLMALELLRGRRRQQEMPVC